jgi:chemotaxis protein methyltransferase CheR
MDFSGPRVTDLLRRLNALARDRQVEDPGGWLQTLAFADWDARLIQQLIPSFSVGETYFRRDSEAFDWLAANHLAPLLARRRREGNRHLRLWSAGCCTGEEAYGLLFLVDELLGKERGRWSVELVASDVNDEFLEQAELGIYGRNAFRSTDEQFRHRYFQAEGREWRVRPVWRDRIRFVRHNLADGSAAPPLQGADLILCRNVLMYFSSGRAVAAVRRLVHSLAPDGLLLLSAVEAGLATEAGFTGNWAGCNYAVTTSNRKRPAKAGTLQAPASALPVRAEPAPTSAVPATPREPPPAPVTALESSAAERQEDPWQQAERVQAEGRHEQARSMLLDYLAGTGLSKAQQHQACLALARSWADQQRVEVAQEWLQKALVLDPASLVAYWLQALLAQQSEDIPAALSALQRALYLEPNFILGHFLRARLLRAEGQRRASGKALRVCRQLLQAQDGETPVPLGEGMSCAQLLRLCEQFGEEYA